MFITDRAQEVIFHISTIQNLKSFYKLLTKVHLVTLLKVKARDQTMCQRYSFWPGEYTTKTKPKTNQKPKPKPKPKG